jgi:hypothetical protein
LNSAYDKTGNPAAVLREIIKETLMDGKIKVVFKNGKYYHVWVPNKSKYNFKKELWFVVKLVLGASFIIYLLTLH